RAPGAAPFAHALRRGVLALPRGARRAAPGQPERDRGAAQPAGAALGDGGPDEVARRRLVARAAHDEGVSSTPRFARASARSFSGCPAWPFTQYQLTRCGAAARSRRCHRSTFFTGFLSAVRQPRRFQLGSHSLMPFWTYWESVWTSTVLGAS